MVRGSALAVCAALALICEGTASVLVPTYVLPPDTFINERSPALPPKLEAYDSHRTIKRLIGGHMKIKSGKEYGAAKNSIDYDEKGEINKFAGVVVPELSGQRVGWNQGIWDDGMLMSSAGGGKESMKMKDDDEDKKTLSDQVAEGKYGLIQEEIFPKVPKRPGIVSYLPNMETRTKDNIQNLGGLKKDEIWLAEDHLLVLKGGAFPERTKEADEVPWQPIDNYEAPRRQVKLPEKPIIPPPFPVRLSDDGPLVFLTPNGSVPAAFFPAYPSGESESSVSSPSLPFAQNPSNSQGNYQGNVTSRGTSLPVPTFPFLPGNASEGATPFFSPINGSFPEGFPPGAVFLPPPSNQSDLYDEEDPSIYYPPPYNFSYHAENNSSVPAGPLVPGIILPPPPDFFAPMEEKTTIEPKTTPKPNIMTITKSLQTKRPSAPIVLQRNKYKKRPSETIRTTEKPTTIISTTAVEKEMTTKLRYPSRVVNIPSRNPVRINNLPIDVPNKIKTEKPIKTRPKGPITYKYPEESYSSKPPTTSANPFIVYSLPGKVQNVIVEDTVTSTPVTLTAYFSKGNEDYVPTTKLKPVYNRKPNDNTLASFYFYDEQSKTSPSAEPYFDGRNYYNTAPVNQPSEIQNINPQTGFTPVDVSYGSLDQADTLFLWPQKQGPRTLTQEYFSIQKPQAPPIYSHSTNQRPNSFYQQIADIQHTLDLITTKRPKSLRSHLHKAKAINSRPVYQFSYQSKPRPEHYSFRVPKLDPEPFRPMVSYSKPFNIENEFNAITPSIAPVTHQQYLLENVQVPTTPPNPTKHYSKLKTKEENYDNRLHLKNVQPNKNRNHIQVHNEKHLTHSNRFPSTTPNPINHGYYTKQDEKYIDEITKNSFDIFGKKLEDSTREHLGVTPPLETVRTPVNNNINLQYAYEVVEPNPPSLEKDTLINDHHPLPVNPDSEPVLIHPILQSNKPHSLLGDTLVNDRPPLPTIDPDSEFVPIPNPVYRPAQQYRIAGEQFDLNSPGLADDTAVNYKRPLPTINPDAEWIAPVNTAGEGRPGSFISYRLPGDGAHVYFLTPQAARIGRTSRVNYRSPGYKR